VTIEVLAGGPLTTLQDRGRSGLRRLGVPRAGALAPAWMTIANRLVGNEANAAVIECFEGGLRLSVHERAIRLSHVGDADVTLLRSGERRMLAPWRSHRSLPGDEIVLRDTGAARLAVIAVQALSVPAVLGSASTYARAGLGGLDGRALAAGDVLSCSLEPSADGDIMSEGAPARAERGCDPFEPAIAADDAPLSLQAVPGPQVDAFDAPSVDAFFATSWTLSAEADRMGARFDGPPLAHRDARSRDIVSDAIVPGSVQVPGSGKPIVMLADAHTAGGYPKIATVLSADLFRLAVQRPGTRFRLERVDTERAIELVRERAHALERHLASITTLPPDAIDTARLLNHNLVDGVTDGAEPITDPAS